MKTFIVSGNAHDWHHHWPRHDFPHVGGSLRGRLQDLQLAFVLLQPHPHHRLRRSLPRLQAQLAAAALKHSVDSLRAHHDGRHCRNCSSGNYTHNVESSSK